MHPRPKRYWTSSNRQGCLRAISRTWCTHPRPSRRSRRFRTAPWAGSCGRARARHILDRTAPGSGIPRSRAAGRSLTWPATASRSRGTLSARQSGRSRSCAGPTPRCIPSKRKTARSAWCATRAARSDSLRSAGPSAAVWICGTRCPAPKERSGWIISCAPGSRCSPPWAAGGTSPRKQRAKPAGSFLWATRYKSWAMNTCSLTCLTRWTRAERPWRRSMTAMSSTQSWTPAIARQSPSSGSRSIWLCGAARQRKPHPKKLRTMTNSSSCSRRKRCPMAGQS